MAGPANEVVCDLLTNCISRYELKAPPHCGVWFYWVIAHPIMYIATSNRSKYRPVKNTHTRVLAFVRSEMSCPAHFFERTHLLGTDVIQLCSEIQIYTENTDPDSGVGVTRILVWNICNDVNSHHTWFYNICKY